MMPRQNVESSEKRNSRVRTRNGCQTCRSRKIKCDLEKPTCRRCAEKGYRCDTGLRLKWEEDYLSRGLAFGRSRTSRPEDPSCCSGRGSGGCHLARSCSDMQLYSGPMIQPYSFINSDSTNFSEASASHGSLPACEPNLWNIATTPFLLSPTSLPSLPKQTDKRFLDYYYQAMCPLTTVGSSSKSPFASILLPFSLVESSNVFHAILALAACHCSKTSNLFRADAMRLKDSVLRSLRKRILSQSSTQVVQDPEILLTMMFMCLYEIVDNCDKMWTVHLRGARDVIRLRRHQTTSSVARANSDPVLCFADRFFAFQDIIGRTACGERQLFGNEYWKAEDDEIDAWMGCSQALARILCTITELSLQKQREILHVVESTEPSFAIRAAELENQLAGLKQSSKTGDRLLEKAAELKRLAAEVYLHCILYDATPSTALIATYVRKILRGISDFLEMGCLAGLTWPLFVAAVELDPINDDLWTELEPGDCIYGRPLVLRALDAMASSTMANVPRTRSVVERVWHARDLDQIADSGQRRTSQHRNDWEAFVAPFSEHMSLT